LEIPKGMDNADFDRQVQKSLRGKRERPAEGHAEKKGRRPIPQRSSSVILKKKNQKKKKKPGLSTSCEDMRVTKKRVLG